MSRCPNAASWAAWKSSYSDRGRISVVVLVSTPLAVVTFGCPGREVSNRYSSRFEPRLRYVTCCPVAALPN